MAIEKMSRFQLFIVDADRKGLLKHLQKFTDVHFVDVKQTNETLEAPDNSAEQQELQEKITRVTWMLQVLEPLEEKKSALQSMKEGVPKVTVDEMHETLEWDWGSLYDSIQADQLARERDRHTIQEIRAKIDDLRPLEKIDVPMDRLGRKSHSTALWGTILLKLEKEMEEAVEETNHLVGDLLTEHRGVQYWQVIYLNEAKREAEDALRKVGFQSLPISGRGTPAEQIALWREQIDQLKDDLRGHTERLRDKLSDLPRLRMLFDALQSEKVKLEAQQNFGQTEYTAALEGYIPTDREAEFRNTLDAVIPQRYALETTPAEKEDPDVPIRLRNNAIVQPFESLTKMYALPRYRELDPTPLLMPFYWAFFGMMAADIGYGLILMIVTGVALKFFNLKEGMRNFMRFFFILSFSVIGWGVIYGSFLGGLIPLPHLIDMNSEFMLLLGLSLALGAVHLFFGMGVAAYLKLRDGKVADAFFDVGLWYMAIIGAILWLISSVAGLPGIVATVSMIVMAVGMVGIVLFGARDSDSIVGRLVGGLYELYGISSYVGDFVSYSRLMALGLSSAFIGVAVNLITRMLIGAGIVGMVLSVFVFVGMHLFNVFLTMLSGYVHTARLTYVEFFGKFYEGGGVPFKSLIHPPKYIEYKTQEVSKS